MVLNSGIYNSFDIKQVNNRRTGALIKTAFCLLIGQQRVKFIDNFLVLIGMVDNKKHEYK